MSISPFSSITISDINVVPVLRGTLNLNRYMSQNGGVAGAGVSSAQRQTNLTVMQAGINQAISDRLFIEFNPDTYEIEGSAGLVIKPPADYGLVFRGDELGSIIRQFTDNAPVLTLGDFTSSSANDYRFGMDLSGVNVAHGNDQSGQTNADALRLGGLYGCKISRIRAGSNTLNGGQRSYRSMRIDGNNAAFFFSNTVSEMWLVGGYQNLLLVSNYGTGNTFENIYCVGGGGPTSLAVTAPVVFGSGGQNMSGNNIDNLNIEWCESNELVLLDVARNNKFGSVHFEGNKLTGADPRFFRSQSSSGLNMDTVNILNNSCRSTEGASGAAAIVRCDIAETVNIRNLRIQQEQQSGGDKFNLILNTHVNITTGLPPPLVRFENLTVADNETNRSTINNLRLGPDLQDAAYTIKNSLLHITNMVHNGVFPQIDGGMMAMLDANFTYYPILKNITIRRNAAPTATRTLTLERYWGPAGSRYSTTLATAGQTVTVTRNAGGGSSQIIANWDGTTLQTQSAAGAVGVFRFDGANWALIAS